MDRRRRALLAWLIGGAMLLPFSAELIAAETLPVSQLLVVTDRGRFPFLVEVAATPAARQQGLMHRQDLGDYAGMLFDFQRPEPVSMWMKDTPISLDMIFIDGHGVVSGVAANTVPYSLDIIPAPQPVRAVLEVRGGTAERLGIHAGSRVIHPMFADTVPAQ